MKYYYYYLELDEIREDNLNLELVYGFVDDFKVKEILPEGDTLLKCVLEKSKVRDSILFYSLFLNQF